MRLVTFLSGEGPRPGILEGDTILPLALPTLIDYIALTPDRRREVNIGSPVREFDLDAPVRPHKNVFCVGRNYIDHAAEIAKARGTGDLNLPSVPTFFTKAPTAIAAPEQTLAFSAAVSQQYDWEAELGVVIGRRCRDVPQEHALDVIFGYTCVNDLTARDLQAEHRQWFKGKSLDNACPIGPCIVTVDELGDASGLEIECRVNGVVKQHSNTSSMIFGVGAIVASLSRGLTLEPGDVIATGTPDGVGFARTPPEFFANGDLVEVEVERVGVLRNRIAIK
jgi:2-keto-4-pentenoate hydratase/2-oxohepta-3-ene-1,7-dioic acid hydratase in catechol pathway